MRVLKREVIKIGKVTIGKGFPPPIQTMWKYGLPGSGRRFVIDKINNYEKLGCGIIRFAVLDMEMIDFFRDILSSIKMPVVADIHFDYRIALKCMDAGFSKIRINPGNIGAKWKIIEVLKKAEDKNIPIRVGINGGSLPKKYRNQTDIVSAILNSAEDEIEIFEKQNFGNVIFSLKSSDVETTITVNRLFYKKYGYLLHIGLTEAGPLIPGIVKNTMALSRLLKNGIGDTIRVSLSDSSENEIITARNIIKQSIPSKKKEGLNIISCPKCSRASFDVHFFSNEIYNTFLNTEKNITIAVMGCEVNGPGESRHADIGISGSGDSVVIFKQGKIIKKIKKEKALDILKDII